MCSCITRTILLQHRKIHGIENHAYAMISLDPIDPDGFGDSPNAEAVRSIWHYVLGKVTIQGGPFAGYQKQTNSKSWSIGQLGFSLTEFRKGVANGNYLRAYQLQSMGRF